MLTRLIVASYAWLVEVALWLTLALAGLVGYHATVPVMSAAGAILTPMFGWEVLGASTFVVVAFLLLATVVGPMLILVDIRHSVRKIEARLDQREDIRESSPVERREPSI